MQRSAVLHRATLLVVIVETNRCEVTQGPAKIVVFIIIFSTRPAHTEIIAQKLLEAGTQQASMVLERRWICQRQQNPDTRENHRMYREIEASNKTPLRSFVWLPTADRIGCRYKHGVLYSKTQTRTFTHYCQNFPW